MPVKSRWTIDIPDCHLATLVFKSPTEPTSKELRLFLDADRPDTHYFTPYEFRLWSQRFAAGLRKSGVEPGDRILFFSPNDLFFPVVFMGTVMAGAIFSGCNPSYTPRELAHQLKDSRAKYLLSADAVLDTAFEGAKIAGLGRDSIFVFNNQVYDGKGQGKKGCQYWGDLIASKEEGARFVWDDLTAPGAAENTTIALNYSSGTTGVAKGVEISHKNYVANSLQVQNLQSLDSKVDISDTRILCFLPMYHAYAQISIVVAMSRGTQIYIMSRFDLLKMLQYIQRFRITSISAVPPVIIALAKHPAVKKFDLSSIRTLASAAAPLGREITKECESLWPDGQVNIKQAWGMTELTCSALGWDPTEKCNSSSVGELNANCEAKIMADDGVTELGQNERGELWIRGPNLMKGYWRNLKATKDTITEDGWLKSGDIAYVDDSGKFFVVDRIKELIKVKGNQVAPAELEAQLLEHPAILDAAVIGVELNNDECPRAYVVLKPGQKVGAADIVEYMDKRVARIKRITGGVVFLNAIPKNPSGKILRKVLRENARKEIQSNGVRANL